MTKETLRKMASNDIDTFIELWNAYCRDINSEDFIYYMYNLDEDAAKATPTDLAFLFFNGGDIYPGTDNVEQFNPNRDYYYYNGYGNLVSFDCIVNDYNGCFLDFIDEDALLEYINENENDFE